MTSQTQSSDLEQRVEERPATVREIVGGITASIMAPIIGAAAGYWITQGPAVTGVGMCATSLITLCTIDEHTGQTKRIAEYGLTIGVAAGLFMGIVGGLKYLHPNL